MLILNTLPSHANIHDPSQSNAYTLINDNGPHLGMVCACVRARVCARARVLLVHVAICPAHF